MKALSQSPVDRAEDLLKQAPTDEMSAVPRDEERWRREARPKETPLAITQYEPKPLLVNFRPDEREQLDQLAEKLGVSRNEIVRRAVRACAHPENEGWLDPW